MRILDCAFIRDHALFSNPGLSTGIHKQPSDEYRIHYVVSGIGLIRINDSKHIIRNDYLFITYPGDSYVISEQGTEVSFTSFLLSFLVEDLDSDLKELLHESTFENRYLLPNKNLHFLFDEITTVFGSKSKYSNECCKHYLLGFLYSITHSSIEEETSASSISHIEKALAIMGTKVKEKLTLGELCRGLNITEPHLIRMFKSYMGISPMKYFMRLKVEEASFLLSESNLLIYQISESLNFSSETHFSRTFKKYKSTTPVNYRNSQIQSLNTRRNRSEMDLAYANKMIQTIIDATPDLIFYKNIEGVYLWCNDAFGKFVGLSKANILGRSDFDIFPKHLAEFFVENDRNIFSHNKAIKNEEWLTFPSGERRKYEVYKAPLHDSSGEILGVLGISRDIMNREEILQRLTEAKIEQEISSRQKSDFLFTMSEGIITSIENIRRETALLASALPDSFPIKNVDFECDYLALISEEIIAFTRFERGDDGLNIYGFNLHELCTRLRKSLYSKYTQFHIDFRIRLHEGVPETVFGDELRLYHLLLLLITTAIKHSRQGIIKIDGHYVNQIATIRIRISQPSAGLEKVGSKTMQPVLSKQEHTFLLKSSGLSLAIAEKHLKLMNGCLKLKLETTDQVEFVVELLLPDSIAK